MSNKVSNKLIQKKAVKLRKAHYQKEPLINGVTNNVTNRLGCCNFRGPLIDRQNVYTFAIELLTCVGEAQACANDHVSVMRVALNRDAHEHYRDADE